ncbi:hypothetical protein VNI00_001372 [Paramarasmius palmivorus]|uniref:Cytochrome P450 n=1 Tax=Paramarasmius palmivorus TaxID=297713 RepID=A0AAW0EA11_9AGAR
MEFASQYLDHALLQFANTSATLKTGLALILTWIIVDITRSFFQRSPYAHLPGPPKTSQLGYLPELHSEESLFDFHYPMTEKYGHVARLQGGFFGLQRDALYVTDPLALNSILVRNQQNFPESIEFSGLFGVIHHGNSLASVWGEHHKKQRKMMNPVFTAAFVSKLTPMFYKIAYQSRDTLAKAVRNSSDGVVDVLDHLTRTALELISQGGLGHSFNSFDHNSKEFNEFHEALKTVLPMSGRIFFVLPYLESWRKLKPDWLRKFFSNAVYYFPWPSLRKFKWGCDTMHPVCKKLFIEKKKMLEEGTIESSAMGGKDLATLLMWANSQAEEEDRMSDEDVVANMSSIVLGGQETTSGALTRLLCLIVKDLDLQQRLRNEINEAKNGSQELPYAELNALPLLDGVCREALRLFSPVTFVWRDTTEDCVVPLQFPIPGPDGHEVKELLISKGTPVYVGLSASNRSRAIWGDDVNELKPERWMGKAILESTENGVKMPGIFSNM